jgi:hypothetical protein
MSASNGEAENPGTGRGRAHGRVFLCSACLKEIIDEDSNGELPVLDLTRCALGVSQDQDWVDADLLARVMNARIPDLLRERGTASVLEARV